MTAQKRIDDPGFDRPFCTLCSKDLVAPNALEIDCVAESVGGSAIKLAAVALFPEHIESGGRAAKEALMNGISAAGAISQQPKGNRNRERSSVCYVHGEDLDAT
jgi:hypothetical protein